MTNCEAVLYVLHSPIIYDPHLTLELNNQSQLRLIDLVRADPLNRDSAGLFKLDKITAATSVR
jgi:hypothetical protein